MSKPLCLSYRPPLDEIFVYRNSHYGQYEVQALLKKNFGPKSYFLLQRAIIPWINPLTCKIHANCGSTIQI